MGSKFNGMSDDTVSHRTANEDGGSRSVKPERAALKTNAAIQEPAFDADLRDALRKDEISVARTLVANAEVILAAHEASESTRAPIVSRADVAAAKARIAIASGDGAAARAILVQAIEAAPKASALRTLMTEVMLATGRAADVRPVLQHLGQAPTEHDCPHDTQGKTQDGSG